MAGPLNYTTKIPVRQSVGECAALLAEAGADAVATSYENRQPVGLSFRLDTPQGRRDFYMPVNIAGVQKMLANAEVRSHIGRAQLSSADHSARVAWRVTKDWLEAQLAIIAAQMATLDQVMLPYLEVGSGRTLYDAFADNSVGVKGLEA